MLIFFVDALRQTWIPINMCVSLSICNSHAKNKIYTMICIFFFLWGTEYSQIINLDVDSILIINWLILYGVMAPNLASLIFYCRALFVREWTVLQHHVFWEAKRIAYGLTERGRNQRNKLEEYYECPDFVYYICIYI